MGAEKGSEKPPSVADLFSSLFLELEFCEYHWSCISQKLELNELQNILLFFFQAKGCSS